MSENEDSIKALIIALFLFTIAITICLILLIIFPRYIFLQLKKQINALPSEKKKPCKRWVPRLSPRQPEEPDIELGELRLNFSDGGDAVQRSQQAGEHDVEMGELPLKYPDAVMMKGQQHPGDLPLSSKSASIAMIERAPDNILWDIDLGGSTTQYPKDWPLSRS
ncbi:hypothetical protein DSL72_009007 [Monilinia vaccinii-corymbosi]|uniref:Uncharacterized protein n=1 Tax=Monilinia vaccinii-corymbosi TaxID=61207 RepID=A0A8A3PN65_9HELO|nr:hypothetical protein DSL72_009007 [Monilinia vaccinii-corymbosi]